MTVSFLKILNNLKKNQTLFYPNDPQNSLKKPNPQLVVTGACGRIDTNNGP